MEGTVATFAQEQFGSADLGDVRSNRLLPRACWDALTGPSHRSPWQQSRVHVGCTTVTLTLGVSHGPT